MDITVYLPEELGLAAKRARLPFSRMLRAAVVEELRRRWEVHERLDELLIPPSTYDGG